VGVAVVVAGALVGVSGSQARVRQLEAWASISHKPILGVSATGFRGALVKHLSAGTYHVSVIASDALGFRLVGPGLNRGTPVDYVAAIPAHPTNTTWTIRLRRGSYQYGLIGPYASDYRPRTRSFQVP
jgi:hypothetical protein